MEADAARKRRTSRTLDRSHTWNLLRKHLGLKTERFERIQELAEAREYASSHSLIPDEEPVRRHQSPVSDRWQYEPQRSGNRPQGAAQGSSCAPRSTKTTRTSRAACGRRPPPLGGVGVRQARRGLRAGQGHRAGVHSLPKGTLAQAAHQQRPGTRQPRDQAPLQRESPNGLGFRCWRDLFARLDFRTGHNKK